MNIWKNKKLNIKCDVVCLWMELSYLRGSLIFHAQCEVDLHWLSCFAMWITFMIWRLLETMFSILLYQLKSIGPKLDTNHEISSRIFSYFAPQWFIWHNFFCVTNITFVIITLRKHSTRNLIYKLLNLH